MDSSALSEVREAHAFLVEAASKADASLPKNENPPEGKDCLRRNLDCAVFEALHKIREEKSDPAYDSVRGVFWEGEQLFPGTTLKEKNYIQFCVRNPNCIKGYFRVREVDMGYLLP